jgi:hypothetical protein
VLRADARRVHLLQVKPEAESDQLTDTEKVSNS